MLSEGDRQKAADILMEAAKTRKQAVQLSVTFPGITFEDAYAISTICAKRRGAAGEKLIGHKVGLTSKAMQQSSQIDEPDYGYLFDSMMVADGAKVPHENYCAPRVEVELAFVLGRELKGPGVGLTDVLRATEYVVPAIEIVDARLINPRKIFDTISDNGAAAGIVVERVKRATSRSLRLRSNIAYRPLPSDLAQYSVMSAARSSSVGAEPATGHRAIPMLAVTDSSRPSSHRGRRTASSTR